MDVLEGWSGSGVLIAPSGDLANHQEHVIGLAELAAIEMPGP